MAIEYEATFANVNKTDIRQRLKAVGATLVRPEFLQKRVNFNLPESHQIKGGWLRVRDEGNRTTMSLKIIDGETITDQKEIQLVVDSFSEAKNLLASIGCREKAFQESRRELWLLDGAEVTIDEWPFLEPFVEVEGVSEAAVKAVAEKLGFDYSLAKFCAVDVLYSEKYGLSFDRINNQTPEITFAMDNPFI